MNKKGKMINRNLSKYCNHIQKQKYDFEQLFVISLNIKVIIILAHKLIVAFV